MTCINQVKRGLFCKAYGTCLTDNGNLHLSRIGHFILDALGNLIREAFGLGIVNLVGTDNDTQFAAGLYCVSLDYTGIRKGELLKVVKTLYICFYDFAACAWTCA